MKKTVAITGGTSFLGREIVNVLKDDFNLHILSRRKQKVCGLETFNGDVNDDNLLKRFLKDSEIVVHVLSISDRLDNNMESINVSLTKKLTDLSLKLQVNKIIYISSENVTYDLKDTYTKSKQEAERIVSNFKNFLIVRPSPIFGKGDTRHIMLYAKLIKFFYIIPVVSSKISKIQPIHVNDVAHLIKRAIEKDLQGTYTVVGTTPLTFKELGLKISEIYGKKRYFINIPYPLIMLLLLFFKFFNKKLYYSIKNALVVRDKTDPSKLEKTFGYSIPSFYSRLRDSLL